MSDAAEVSSEEARALLDKLIRAHGVPIDPAQDAAAQGDAVDARKDAKPMLGEAKRATTALPTVGRAPKKKPT